MMLYFQTKQQLAAGPMECESYNLNWAEFDSYTSKTFRDLLSSQEYTDVTLVCDDDDVIRAHKVILSACSPFFNRILKKTDQTNPMVYLSDVNLNELKAIVNFMYLGQTNVEQENLQRFLKIAAKFQVRGLTDNKTEDNSDVTAGKSCKKMPGLSKVKNNSYGEQEELFIPGPAVEDHSQAPGYYYENNLTGPDDLEDMESVDTNQLRSDPLRSEMGVMAVGEDNKYPCDQCDYKATYACNLASHKRTVHEGVYYTCSLCSYKSSRKDRLNKHYLNKHGNND